MSDEEKRLREDLRLAKHRVLALTGELMANDAIRRTGVFKIPICAGIAREYRRIDGFVGDDYANNKPLPFRIKQS